MSSTDHSSMTRKPMARARSEIRLETYIFDFSGGTGQVAEALMQAARRGVETCVLVDGFGTGELPPEWLQRFQAAGVECRVYSPLGMLGLLGLLSPGRWRRLHRKLCVVDGREAMDALLTGSDTLSALLVAGFSSNGCNK